MKSTFAENGPILIRAVFRRVQGELMRPTVEALADILLFYFKEFTTDTRYSNFYPDSKFWVLRRKYGTQSRQRVCSFEEKSQHRKFEITVPSKGARLFAIYTKSVPRPGTVFVAQKNTRFRVREIYKTKLE